MSRELPAHLRRKKSQKKLMDLSWINDVCHKIRSSLARYQPADTSVSRVSHSHISTIASDRESLLAQARLSIEALAQKPPANLSHILKDSNSSTNDILAGVSDEPSLDASFSPSQEPVHDHLHHQKEESVSYNGHIETIYEDEDIDQVDDFADEAEVDEADALDGDSVQEEYEDEFSHKDELFEQFNEHHELSDNVDEDEEEDELSEDIEEDSARQPLGQHEYVELSSEQEEDDVEGSELDDGYEEEESVSEIEEAESADDFDEDEEEEVDASDDLDEGVEEHSDVDEDLYQQELEREKVEDSEDADAEALDPNLSEAPADSYEYGFDLDVDAVQKLVAEYGSDRDELIDDGLHFEDGHINSHADLEPHNDSSLPTQKPLEQALEVEDPLLVDDPETVVRNDTAPQAVSSPSIASSDSNRPETPTSPEISQMSLHLVGFDIGLAPNNDTSKCDSDNGDVTDHTSAPESVVHLEASGPQANSSVIQSPPADSPPLAKPDLLTPETPTEVPESFRPTRPQDDDNPYMSFWNLFNVGFSVGLSASPDEEATETQNKTPLSHHVDEGLDVSAERDAQVLGAKRLLERASLFGGTPITPNPRRESLLSEDKPPVTSPAKESQIALELLAASQVFGGESKVETISAQHLQEEHAYLKPRTPVDVDLTSQAEAEKLAPSAINAENGTSHQKDSDNTLINDDGPQKIGDLKAGTGAEHETQDEDKESTPRNRRLRPRDPEASAATSGPSSASQRDADSAPSGRTTRHKRKASSSSRAEMEPPRKRELRARGSNALEGDDVEKGDAAQNSASTTKAKGRKPRAPKGKDADTKEKPRGPGRPKRK